MNKPIIEASCVVDGVEYYAETSLAWDCTKCDGHHIHGDNTCGRLGPCGPGSRADHSIIIWVRAQ